MSAHISGGYAKEPPTYGKVLLHTTVGDIDVELWPKQSPKACRNFVQLAMEGYYDNNSFHRVIPNFMAQTGDPSGTGEGGESIYSEAFKDEFHSRLKFTHRGIVAMANSGKNNNNSQFFITLDKCDWLNRKHTIFGKVTGNTIYNVLKFNDNPQNQQINDIEILLNPFDDIQPRIDQKIKRKKDKKDKENERMNKENELKELGAKKDNKLLAFGDDEDEEQDFIQIEKETNDKIKKLKNERKKREIDQEIKVQKNDSKMMDVIRSKLSAKNTSKISKKRTFSEMDDENDNDLSSKKRKMDTNNDEYELLKKQLLEKQQENNNEADYGDDDDDDDDDVVDDDETEHVEVDGVAKLIKQREEYMKKTRMNKKERNKYTLNKLNEFIEIIDGSIERENENNDNKKKGKLDINTGIEFENDSDEDDDEYDPNWFKSKLEFKKRPQDIFSVDDYKTIYGNNTNHEDKNKNKNKKHCHRHRR